MINNNVVCKIQPYRYLGGWAFDDETRGLKTELFVFGMPQIIDKIVNDKNCKRCNFIFSNVELPEYDTVLVKISGQGTRIGTYYTCSKTKLMGWLCPALKLYLDPPPENLYVRIERLYE